jgi:hypothetical protein
MRSQTVSSEALTSACQVFLERHPEYEAIPGNSRILVGELLRLSDEENMDPASVYSVEAAFENKKHLLKLKELPPVEQPLESTLAYFSQEYFRELSADEKEALGIRLSTLSPRERDGLPDHLARFLVSFEFKKSREPKTLDPATEILLPLFVELGYSDSVRNRAIVGSWLNSKKLEYTLSNLQLAVEETKEHLDLSEVAIDRLSSQEFKKRILDPAIKKDRAEKEKQPKRQREGPPPGFDYVSWVNGQ